MLKLQLSILRLIPSDLLKLSKRLRGLSLSNFDSLFTICNLQVYCHSCDRIVNLSPIVMFKAKSNVRIDFNKN